MSEPDLDIKPYLEELKSIENVREHRTAICRAMDMEYSDDMLIRASFIGWFTGPERDYLDALGLINRGFCPICGISPIGIDHPRRTVNSTAVEYLCEDCWTETNPHLNVPGYTRRYYTAKLVIWAIGAGLLVLLLLGLRGCARVLF